jgi:Transglycosylase SLT domain
MKQRLLLILALAVLATATAGAVTAPAGPLGSGTGDVNIDLPEGQDLPDVGGALPACANTADDDGDGAVDLADPGCSGPTDGDEYNAPPAPPGGGTTTTPGDTTTTTPAPTPSEPGVVPVEPGGGGTGGGGGGTGGGGGGGGNGGAGGGGNGGNGNGGTDGDDDPREQIEKPDIRNPDGTPTNSNPGLSIAEFGPAPVGISNYIIRDYEIPPFLLPIFNACGTQYGIPWNVLASISKIESAFGTNMGPSSAGAIGPMQFLPSTWKAYGVDANGDGVKDPYNFVDSICGAARYLNASGGETDLARAIFAYNHAQWYVDEVLLIARQYGKLPEGLIGSLTGLTEGAHFPVAADARYADDIAEREILERSNPTPENYENAAQALESSPSRDGINIYSKENAPVVAVNDGTITEIGKSEKLGNYMVLRDAWGNEFTYAQLGAIADAYPVPQEQKLSAEDFELTSSKEEEAPDQPASDPGTATSESSAPESQPEDSGPVNSEDLRPRLYAYPERPHNVDQANLSGQLDELLNQRFPAYETFKDYFGGVLKFDRDTMEMKPLEEGSQVVAGTVLGRIQKTDEDLAPHLHFMITPAGKKAEPIDPKPILDGWKLLEATAIYRARGENPFVDGVDVSSILLMSKTELERYVLDEPRIEIYECGREDIQTHQINRRVLVTLGVLAARGFRLGITSLKCGHSYFTTSGSVSHHSSGNAVDIAQVNGLPILGHQGAGSITEAVIRELLRMQEPYQCDQIISLMEMGGPTFAMSDHDDHIHCGFTPEYNEAKTEQQFAAVLDSDQWSLLLDQIAQIDNPKVQKGPSDYAIPTKKRASDAHLGE